MVRRGTPLSVASCGTERLFDSLISFSLMEVPPKLGRYVQQLENGGTDHEDA